MELDDRESLIEKVISEGKTIKQASEEMNINYSTAKHILKVFRKTGRAETLLMLKRQKKNKEDVDMDSSPQTQESSEEITELGRQLPLPENTHAIIVDPQSQEHHNMQNFF